MVIGKVIVWLIIGTLAGTLAVIMTPAFPVGIGERFEVIRYSSASFDFSTFKNYW